jgi:transposase
MNNPLSASFAFHGPAGELPIGSQDLAGQRLAMLIEVKCYGRPPEEVARKYGYSLSRYYQLLRAYREGGVAALAGRKKGPRRNYVRTRVVENQILRFRFLDPKITPAVIAQRLNQRGFRVSQRSVERTLAEFTIQKKTAHLESG